jgi:hypothetical protein
LIPLLKEKGKGMRCPKEKLSYKSGCLRSVFSCTSPPSPLLEKRRGVTTRELFVVFDKIYLQNLKLPHFARLIALLPDEKGKVKPHPHPLSLKKGEG